MVVDIAGDSDVDRSQVRGRAGQRGVVGIGQGEGLSKGACTDRLGAVTKVSAGRIVSLPPAEMPLTFAMPT